MYLLMIMACAFSCVIGYFIGLTVADQNEDLLREMFPKVQTEVYEDHENAETIVFITLKEEPAYSIKEIVLNDGESLRLYREAREI